MNWNFHGRFLLLSFLIHLFAITMTLSLSKRPFQPNSFSSVSVFTETLESGRYREKKGHSSIPGVRFENGTGYPKIVRSESLSHEKSSSSVRAVQELLLTESKVWDVFDALAGRIHRYLDYPEFLVENGVSGGASLDLYFDSQGDIDEVRSKTSGDNKLVRGLLIRATRKALEQWVPFDSVRLRKEQFRNQHFRADFVLAYSQTERSELIKIAPGSYGFMRRRVSNISCLGEIGGAPTLNIACVVAGIGGAVYRNFSDKYKSQFMALKDLLESYDEMNLNGINNLIRRT